ncbi:MAG TPA: site-2 protease family protein [Candidatus Nanoarchaeia archaeon]|nr:site-2 protease family protein [Candidatus Nanoarchaeia archaeon]
MNYSVKKFGFLSYSNIEIIDITKAWFAISVAFGIVLGGLSSLFFKAFIISAVAVGLGFLLHELSHKVVAQRYKYKAEFRSFDEMLFLAVIMSFFGFVIAAPGAVMIQAFKYNNKHNGMISAAGPLTNIILALLFLAAMFLTGNFSLLDKPVGTVVSLPIFSSILLIGFFVNSWLALFNMIPVWQFDGAKIFRWNKIIYFSIVIVSAFLVFGL